MTCKDLNFLIDDVSLPYANGIALGWLGRRMKTHNS